MSKFTKNAWLCFALHLFKFTTWKYFWDIHFVNSLTKWITNITCWYLWYDHLFVDWKLINFKKQSPKRDSAGFICRLWTRLQKLPMFVGDLAKVAQLYSLLNWPLGNVVSLQKTATKCNSTLKSIGSHHRKACIRLSH